MTSSVPRPVMTATMTIGNTRRMPNTAIRMPTVRNIFCQNGSMVLSTEALMTALSNDSEISSTPSTVTSHSAGHSPMPEWRPHHAASTRHTAVKAREK